MKLVIELGAAWRRFSPPRDDIQLLGSVQQGAAIGALAQHVDGRFVQLNGDVERRLNTSRVRAVLARERSKSAARRARAERQAARQPSPAQVTVTVKRRRTFAPEAAP